MLIELKSLNIHEGLIADIAQRFRDNVEISDVCSTVISKIEELVRIEEEKEKNQMQMSQTKSLWRRLQMKNNPAIF